MNKYLIILLTALSLSLVSAQATAGYKCYTWKEHGVKYTKCYHKGYKCYDCYKHHHRHHRHHHGYHHGHHGHGHHHGHHGHHH